MMYGVSATSILYFLFSKHEDASSQYKQMGERLDDQTLSAYMHELEQFHSGQSNGIRKLLNDMSPSPMPRARRYPPRECRGRDSARSLPRFLP